MQEIDGKVLRVSFGYGLKANRGNYQSEDAHVSFSLEETIDAAATNDEIVRRATDIEQTLESGAKLLVYGALNLGFAENEGTLQPVFDVPDVPVAAPKKAASKPNPYGGGGGQGDRQPSLIQSQPKVVVDFGEGAIEYFDTRGLKKSGQYKQTANDFRSVEKQGDRFHPVWLYGKDGTPNEKAIAAATAAGLL